jgi:hypothetical protein
VTPRSSAPTWRGREGPDQAAEVPGPAQPVTGDATPAERPGRKALGPRSLRSGSSLKLSAELVSDVVFLLRAGRLLSAGTAGRPGWRGSGRAGRRPVGRAGKGRRGSTAARTPSERHAQPHRPARSQGRSDQDVAAGGPSNPKASAFRSRIDGGCGRTGPARLRRACRGQSSRVGQAVCPGVSAGFGLTNLPWRTGAKAARSAGTAPAAATESVSGGLSPAERPGGRPGRCGSSACLPSARGAKRRSSLRESA